MKATILAVALLAVLLHCYGVVNIYCSTVHENGPDLRSLLDYKHGVNDDPRGALSSWNTSIHYCQWAGVMCTSTRPRRVTALNLTGLSLAGEISSSLANLTFLTQVDLSSNRLFGQLPPLNGPQQLDILYLNGNSLEGMIPDAPANCSKLTFLDLSSNNFTGVIPNRLWQLPSMTVLLLGNNMLTGEIPRDLNMSSLQALGLEFNMLGKRLPSNMGDAHPNLSYLKLGGNTFEGHIPASLGNASGLEIIDLSNNSFTGQVPASLGNLQRLARLYLSDNSLTGVIG